MNVYRSAALATAAALAGITLTACQGGIATPGSSPAANSSSTSSSPAAASSPPSTSSSTPPTSNSSSPSSSSGSSSSGTVSVGSLGSFPIPPGAQVAENVTSGTTTDIVLGSVSASAVNSFYQSALPAAGYTITSSSSGTSSILGGGLAAINFTGHGYKGEIGALDSLGISFGGGGTVGITLSPQ